MSEFETPQPTIGQMELFWTDEYTVPEERPVGELALVMARFMVKRAVFHISQVRRSGLLPEQEIVDELREAGL